MRSDRKQTILFIIILLVLSMGIGYAFLTTTLTIDGVSDIDSAVWDIHFDNLEVQNSSVSGNQVISPATITNNGTSISFHVKLNEPGEGYAFSFDMINGGTLNAYIEDIDILINGSSNNSLPTYLKQDLLEYNSGNHLAVGYPLFSGETDKLMFYILYDPDVYPDNLPGESESITISINISFAQLISRSNYNNMYVYTVDETTCNIGSELPANGIFYQYYYAPLKIFSGSSFIRHYVENNLITTSDVGVIINDDLIYLTGGDGGSSYSSNKTKLQSVFESGNCTEEVSEGVSEYRCSNSYPHSITVCSDGRVRTYIKPAYYCNIYADGSSGCYVLYS